MPRVGGWREMIGGAPGKRRHRRAPSCQPHTPSALLSCPVQTVIDAPNSKKSDLRRARSAMLNLAPTSTGSATAIALIFPGGRCLHRSCGGCAMQAVWRVGHGSSPQLPQCCKAGIPRSLLAPRPSTHPSPAPPSSLRPRAQGQAQRAGGACAAAQRLHHRLRVRGGARHHRGGGQCAAQGGLVGWLGVVGWVGGCPPSAGKWRPALGGEVGGVHRAPSHEHGLWRSS